MKEKKTIMEEVKTTLEEVKESMETNEDKMMNSIADMYFSLPESTDVFIWVTDGTNMYLLNDMKWDIVSRTFDTYTECYTGYIIGYIATGNLGNEDEYVSYDQPIKIGTRVIVVPSYGSKHANSVINLSKTPIVRMVSVYNATKDILENYQELLSKK